jgi:hypothetical protein
VTFISPFNINTAPKPFLKRAAHLFGKHQSIGDVDCALNFLFHLLPKFHRQILTRQE